MREEEGKLKALTAKEREEYKRMAARLTGGRVSPWLFGRPYKSFAFQDVSFLSATRTSLRPMLPCWKREPYRSMQVSTNEQQQGRMKKRIGSSSATAIECGLYRSVSLTRKTIHVY
jgi:hypothetical protein